MNLYTKIRALLLFMNPISLYCFYKVDKELNRVVSKNDFNQFDAKSVFTLWQRCEESVLYGYSLSRQQRTTQNDLHKIPINDSDVLHLLTGKYIRKSGCLVAFLPIEMLIFVLSLISTIGVAIIYGGIVIALFFIHLPVEVKIKIFCVILALNIFPVYQIYCRILRPSFVYLVNHKKICKELS